ncbi:hypothetical protein NZD85_06445 [Empedobacter stercoris]|uniref:Outer membrane protein beta-barrel domain-containing protein n=1 Tax=Empedobacter stercoris TaxID=1628248 RepID=A0ABX1WN29_9FLAO|nr:MULTISPECIES: hypothetical protein [Empedobacter]HJD87395.1 hypothetical protein [Empedobacter falsenii]MCA4777498.1 hypothetical protein [Empedobacter stercoris]MCA4810405.1 hypothetical protein [Empedobacter stercoris]MDM1523004.1 hypothetical protein [Empedobacter sp. 225-1]MDM1543004.1 hypothetical protein [Empedobacter sp. 189-2]
MKKLLLFIISLTLSSTIYAQINQNQPFNNNWRFGGGLGLSFGNNGYFGFNVSPSVGYMIANNLELGATAGYQYAKDDYAKLNLFNAGPYVNFFPVENLFLRANYMYYTGKQKYNERYNYNYETNLDESALWLGAGYQSSGPVRFQAGVMYNVLYKENESIFSSGFQPFMGVSIGL